MMNGRISHSQKQVKMTELKKGDESLTMTLEMYSQGDSKKKPSRDGGGKHSF